jgi:hypothetical protein
MSYIDDCAALEHFLEYRQIVRGQIESQLAELKTEQTQKKPVAIA